MSAPRAHQLNGGYDESLLADSPEVSKAAKQEGYNVDLLDEPRTMRVTPTPRSTDPQSVVPKEHYHSIGTGAGARKVPFWRTRGGMISLAVLVIVIVGAVVGGAVGGTVGKPAKKEAAQAGVSSSSPATQPTQPTQSQSQAQAQAPVASGSGAAGSSSTPSATSQNAQPVTT